MSATIPEQRGSFLPHLPNVLMSPQATREPMARNTYCYSSVAASKSVKDEIWRIFVSASG